MRGNMEITKIREMPVLFFLRPIPLRLPQSIYNVGYAESGTARISRSSAWRCWFKNLPTR